MILEIAFCVFVCLSSASGRIATTETYSHSVTLRTGNIKVYWKFNESHITFEVHGETTGWIGIGFSQNGAMTGADIIVGWVKNDEVTVTDRHGVANAFPPLDPQQDINVLGGSECDGWTMFKFSRQLAACEPEYDREISKSTQKLIWAWGTSDPTGDDIESANYHGIQRGAESMYFLASSEKPSVLPEGPVYKTFEIRMDKFALPAEETYYNCKIFQLPKLTKKHHIVKFEPIVQEGNELHVHHMLIYRCGDKLEDPTELHRQERCFSPNMQHFKTCTTAVAEWAVGAGATIYPEEAGLSIGSSDDPRYIQMEMHYDNPMRTSGVVDSSGIRFTYTDTLRKYDVGVLSVGAWVNGVEHFLPPGAETFSTVTHCLPKCLSEIMKTKELEELTVFRVLLHSHLAGRALKLRHIRGGVELPTPAFEDNYDFNFQEGRFIYPHMKLKPNDTLQMECVYSTKGKKNITQSGVRSSQEMCIAFTYYYPKVNYGGCHSSVPRDVLWKFFGINFNDVKYIGQGLQNLEQEYWKVGNMDTNASKSLLDYANEFQWDPETVKKFEAFYNSATHRQICLPDTRKNIIFYQYNVSDVEITAPYVEPLKECNELDLPLTQKLSSDRCLTEEESTTSTPSGTTAMKLSRSMVAILLPVVFIILK